MVAYLIKLTGIYAEVAFNLTLAMLFGLTVVNACLLYTSDAADERSSVDLGGRRIIKKKITQLLI